MENSASWSLPRGSHHSGKLWQTAFRGVHIMRQVRDFIRPTVLGETLGSLGLEVRPAKIESPWTHEPHYDPWLPHKPITPQVILEARTLVDLGRRGQIGPESRPGGALDHIEGVDFIALQKGG